MIDRINIDRIVELFNNIDRKTKILIYLIVILVAGIMAYYINYNILYKNGLKQERKVRKLEKEYKKFEKEVKTAAAQIFTIKKIYEQKQKQYSLLKDDIKYVEYKISISKLRVTKKDFYSLLNKILEISSKNHLNINYSFYKNINNSLNLTQYVIDMNGVFSCKDYKNFKNFIINLELLKVVKSFDKVNITKGSDNNLSFDISLSIWSL